MHKRLGYILLLMGIALNFGDAYLSKQLSPALSEDGTITSTGNLVSSVNNLLPIPTGTLLAIIGIFFIVKG